MVKCPFFQTNKQTETVEPLTTKPVASNQTAPLYEYHVKTVAIIEGSNSPINVNDLLSGKTSSISQDNDHHLSKRQAANLTADTGIFSPLNKEIVKRHSYEGRQNQRKPFPGRGMTQAIIKPSPTLRSRSTSSQDDDDIEGFFRKNVPIYDGIPAAQKVRVTSNFQRYPSSSYFGRDEEDEEEQDKPMSLEEVDPEHDSQYEHVHMMVGHDGKQKVMEIPQEDEEEEEPYSKPYRPPYSFPKYQNSHLEDSPYRTPSFPANFKRPSTFDRPPSFNRPSFDDPSFDHPSFRSPAKPAISYNNPPTYGTSHQYNSLADDQPRYYKHFSAPLRQHDGPSSSDDEPSYPFPSTNHFSNENSPDNYRSNFDFSSDRSPPRPYSSGSNQNPYRTSHVPQTLEEYHRLHNTFGKSRPVYNPHKAYNSRFNSPRNLPQDDAGEEEDEKEEKDDKDEKEEADDDKEDSSRSRPFVSMNFKTFGRDNDDGISIQHHLVPGSRSSYSSYRPRSEATSETEDVEYPTLPVVESSEAMQDTSKFKENSDAVKSFVDSIFNKNKALEMGTKDEGRKVKNSFGSSQPTFNFGDRVKTASKPAQNILWHRKDAAPRERSSSRVDFDKLRADFSKPKRNTVAKNSTIIIVDDLPESNEMATVKSDPSEKIVVEKKSIINNWSEPYSEPSK